MNVKAPPVLSGGGEGGVSHGENVVDLPSYLAPAADRTHREILRNSSADHQDSFCAPLIRCQQRTIGGEVLPQ